MRAQCEIRADVLAFALDAIENRVDLFVRHRIYAPELGVEVSCIRGYGSLGVDDLVVDHHWLVVEIFKRNARLFPERHGPVGIEGASRVDADGQRRERRVFVPSHGEKIADWNFNRWFGFAVPVDAEDGKAPVASGRHPDVLNLSRSINICQCKGLSRIHVDGRADFPALSQITSRGTASPPSVAMPPFPFSPVRFSGLME